MLLNLLEIVPKNRSKYLTGKKIIEGISSGVIKPSGVLELCFEAIERYEPMVGAWSVLDMDKALKRAISLDTKVIEGILYGVPIGIKDNIDTSDMATQYGTNLYPNYIPARDSSCVASLLMAGAIALGKTVCTEFAHRAPGKTTNPWNVLCSPGGSSSGSAAAVASGMVPISIGTQTTGSVIRPAAYCGVIGYKPTFGVFNVSGVLANTPSFDTLGFFSRCIEDLILIRKSILDKSIPSLSNIDLRNAKVGIARNPYWNNTSPSYHKMIEIVASTLSKAGAKITEFHGNGAFENLEEIGMSISGYEFARTLTHERRCFYDQLSPILRDGRMADGINIVYSDYVSSLQRIEKARIKLDFAISEVDFVICPSAPGPAPEGLPETGSAALNMAWTWLHAPVVTLPVALDDKTQLPLGLQMVGRRHGDDKLLGYADAVFNELIK